MHPFDNHESGFDLEAYEEECRFYGEYKSTPNILFFMLVSVLVLNFGNILMAVFFPSSRRSVLRPATWREVKYSRPNAEQETLIEW